MKLDAVRLRSVRRFGPEGVAFEGLSSGLNIIAEPNEFGKSTLLDALYALFFVKHRSKAREAKALEPYDGGAPHVEAEVTTPDGRYRLEKQFSQRASCTVTDLDRGHVLHRADDAEAFIESLGGGDAKDGPATLLWVRQGAPLQQPTAGALAAEGFREMLAGEVSDMTGGERTRRVLQRAEDALAAVLTPKARKPIGAYKEALERRDALKTDILALGDTLRQTEAAREALSSVQKELRRLDDPSARQESRDKREEALRLLKRGETAAMETARLEAICEARRAAHERSERALSDLNALLNARDQLAATKRSLTDAQAKAAAQSQRLRQDRAALTTVISQAERSLADAEQVQADAFRSAQAAAAHTQIQSLERQLTQVRELLAERAELAPFAARPPADLPALEAAEEKVLVESAALRAEAPRLKVVTAEEAVRVGDTEVPAGTELPLTQSVLIAVGDTRMELTVPGRADRHAALGDAREERDRLLRAAGAESVREARDAEDTRRRSTRRIKDIDTALKRDAPEGVAALERAISDARATAEMAGSTEISFYDAREGVAAARDHLAQLRGRRDALDKAIADAESDVATATARLDGVCTRLDEVEAEIGNPETVEARLYDLKETCANELLGRQEADEALARHRHAIPDLDPLRTRLKRLEEQETNRQTQREKMAEQQATLKETIRLRDAQGAEEKLAELNDQLDDCHRRIAQVERDIRALTLLESTLRAAEARRRDRFLAPIMAEVMPFVGTLFPNAGLVLDDQFSPVHFHRDGVEEEVLSLSGGTREQLAILTRLGYARMMARRGHPVPVILDDALVYADDDRIERMFDAFHHAGEDVQVLVLTCRRNTFSTLGHRIIGRPVGMEGDGAIAAVSTR